MLKAATSVRPANSPCAFENLEDRRMLSASGPHVTALTLDDRGQAIINFDQPLRALTVGKYSAQVITAGPDGTFGTADDVVQRSKYSLTGSRLTVTATLAGGTPYHLHLSSYIKGGNGKALRGAFDGTFPTTGGAADFNAATAGESDIVLYNTSKGQMLLQLNSATPITTANFVTYADSTKYDNTFIQRNGKSDAAPLGPISILQAGGFEVNASDKLDRITTLNTGITHETTGGSNLRGTIALARSSSADSGSAEYFFNETDNTFLDPTPNDPNAGTPTNDPGAGYTVFGSLLGASSLKVLDSIYALKTQDLNPSSNGQEQDVGLHSVPIIGNPTATTFDPRTNLVVIQRVAPLMEFTAV